LPETSGSAGWFLSKKPKPGKITSEELSPSLKKVCADLAAGWDVSIAGIKKLARLSKQCLEEGKKVAMANKDIQEYNGKQTKEDKKICDLLMGKIDKDLTKAEGKVWHGHPVWFLDGNPIVGYSKQKLGIRLMFWSGADFNEEKLVPGTGKFKDASIFYNNVAEVNSQDLKDWLGKARNIQWDYKNIVKRKGQLLRLK
jgi:hypothetical protein